VVVTLASVVVVAAVAVGAVRFRQQPGYSPLEPSGTGGFSGDGVTRGSALDPTSGEPDPAVIDYRPGARIDLLEGIANSGRRSITITGVEIPGGPPIALERAGYLGPEARDMDPSLGRRFGRVHVGPHEVATVVLHVRLRPACLGAGPDTFTTLTTMLVHFELFGRRHTQHVDLLMPLRVVFHEAVPRDPDCKISGAG
jgi:hypothetical protein